MFREEKRYARYFSIDFAVFFYIIFIAEQMAKLAYF